MVESNKTSQKVATGASAPRPPVVVVMGHIDHGKSTLLDYIRKTNVVEKEFGGITQHISAYEVSHKREDGDLQRITFLDTPGHAAFQAMRSRGAAVADIAILVVSAEDGVKPQTIEALNAITEANLPYIVAINKIDKPNANIEKTKQSLTEHGIYLEGYGGTVPSVAISAKKGDHVSELLDMIVLLADLAEFKGDVNAEPSGVVIESNLDSKKGITATVIIKNGTLQSSGCVVAGNCVSPLRMMEDFTGKKINEATFSSPVRIIGWNSLPKVGTTFKGCTSKKEAEEAALTYQATAKEISPIEEQTAPEGAVVIPVILKADVAGVADTMVEEVKKLSTEKVFIKIISSSAGTISENDIKNAVPFEGAIVLGFNIKIEPKAKDLADRNGITVKTYNVIYEATDWLKEVVAERTPKVRVEEVRGELKVLKVFSQNKDTQVVGGKILSGSIAVRDLIRIIRRDNEVGRGEISELQQSKIKTKEVTEGECGVEVSAKISIAAGDVLQAITHVIK